MSSSFCDCDCLSCEVDQDCVVWFGTGVTEPAGRMWIIPFLASLEEDQEISR